MYERVIYVSQASPGMDEQAAYAIVRTAHNRNARDALTGGLLLLDGYFVQVLEGYPALLRLRFERINADSRHHSVSVRQTLATHERLFAQDWMALRQASEVPASLREVFGYRPGLPPESISPERIAAFVHACCHHHAEA